MRFKKRGNIKRILAIATTVTLITSCTNKSNIIEANTSTEKITIDINIENKIVREIIEKENNIEYLKDNMTIIDVNNLEDFSELDMLYDEISDKEVFLTGEVHGVQGNTDLEMKFLKFFKEVGGINYYLCEIQYSYAYYLNKYLESGDEEILKKVYRNFSDSAQGKNKDNFNHWKRVYEYNKTLSEGEKIKIVGVDIVHNSGIAIEYLEEIINQKGINNQLYLGGVLEKGISYNNIFENFDKIMDDLSDNEKSYRAWLQEEFLGVKQTVRNLVYGSRAERVTDKNSYNSLRDQFIWENFKEVYEELPKGKYFGQWGCGHIYQEEVDGVKYIAGLMNERKSPLNGKVLSIMYGYSDCKAIMYNRKFDAGLIPKGVKDIVDENHTMFKLNGLESPFKAGNIYQYLVVIKNAEASERLDDEIK